MATTSDAPLRAHFEDLIGGVIDACPRRVATSDSERRAQERVERQLTDMGLETSYQPFTYNESLYAAVGLHFVVATLGIVLFAWLPAVALVLHLVAGISYFGDSTRRYYWLRRLLPYKKSQNLLGTAPAVGEPKLRLVLLGHIDASFTGLAFDPRLLKLVAHPTGIGRIFYKSLRAATVCVFVLAAIDVLALFIGTHHWWLWLLILVPGFLVVTTALLNVQIVLKNNVVPGADDNLAGVCGCLEIAKRVVPTKPDGVELVVGITGCEEAGTGGALAMARHAAAGAWSRDDTVVLALDSIANGHLCYWQEGEIIIFPVPQELATLVAEVAPRHPDNGPVPRWEMPEGATDATPFLAYGYDALGFGCIDTTVNVPYDYHVDEDTLANMDMDQLLRSIDFLTDYVETLMAKRTAAP